MHQRSRGVFFLFFSFLSFFCQFPLNQLFNNGSILAPNLKKPSRSGLSSPTRSLLRPLKGRKAAPGACAISGSVMQSSTLGFLISFLENTVWNDASFQPHIPIQPRRLQATGLTLGLFLPCRPWVGIKISSSFPFYCRSSSSSETLESYQPTAFVFTKSE